MFLAISPLVPCEDTQLVCSVYFFFLVLFVVVKCNTIHVIFLIEFFKSYFSVTALTLCGIPQRFIFRSNNPSFSSVICLSLPKVWCYSTLIKISLLVQQNDYCGKVLCEEKLCVRTECGDLRSKSAYSVQMQENKDQK